MESNENHILSLQGCGLSRAPCDHARIGTLTDSHYHYRTRGSRFPEKKGRARIEENRRHPRLQLRLMRVNDSLTEKAASQRHRRPGDGSTKQAHSEKEHRGRRFAAAPPHPPDELPLPHR